MFCATARERNQTKDARTVDIDRVAVPANQFKLTKALFMRSSENVG